MADSFGPIAICVQDTGRVMADTTMVRHGIRECPARPEDEVPDLAFVILRG
jgi:precorrin isomerase